MHMDKILANYNYCCLLLVTRRLLLRNVKSRNRRIVKSMNRKKYDQTIKHRAAILLRRCIQSLRSSRHFCFVFPLNHDVFSLNRLNA